MKSKKMKMFPLIIMLVAGSITSIMTYYFQYEIKLNGQKVVFSMIFMVLTTVRDDL